MFSFFYSSKTIETLRSGLVSRIKLISFLHSAVLDNSGVYLYSLSVFHNISLGE